MTNSIALPPSTRVWIYQSNQPFAAKDTTDIRQAVQTFAQQWVSHNRQLRAHADILHDRFIVLMVDESQAGASGCSIDKSVYFLKDLQAQYDVDLFDRMQFSYLDGEVVQTVSKDAFRMLYLEGKINDETPVFDTLVNNKGDFDAYFIKPLKKSWHKRMI
ncbi:MAG TPA: hypothetical protein PKD70_07905 [Saprospiraceae bacterium]|nr:hypothetical protein [Saprospiraceae bacterium]HMP13788.1 hypothetical protein [Saprospiraceae bacterium]